MAEIIDTSSTSDLVMEEKTTDSGEKYQIGRPQGSENVGEPDSHGPPFSIPVNWVPGSDWQYTDDDFRGRTGISRWKITVGGFIYHYQLFFDTDQTYNYTFTDKTGQGYGNNVFVAGVHSINYNSNQPTIVLVSGE